MEQGIIFELCGEIQLGCFKTCFLFFPQCKNMHGSKLHNSKKSTERTYELSGDDCSPHIWREQHMTCVVRKESNISRVATFVQTIALREDVSHATRLFLAGPADGCGKTDFPQLHATMHRYKMDNISGRYSGFCSLQISNWPTSLRFIFASKNVEGFQCGCC